MLTTCPTGTKEVRMAKVAFLAFALVVAVVLGEHVEIAEPRIINLPAHARVSR